MRTLSVRLQFERSRGLAAQLYCLTTLARGKPPGTPTMACCVQILTQAQAYSQWPMLAQTLMGPSFSCAPCQPRGSMGDMWYLVR